MYDDIETRLNDLFPAASVPDYKGKGVARWALLNDAPVFSEADEETPQMKATEGEFYADISRLIARIETHQRKS